MAHDPAFLKSYRSIYAQLKQDSEYLWSDMMVDKAIAIYENP